MIEPGLFNYWIAVILMMIGFYTVISRGNLIKKIVGLNIFQTSVFLLYISFSKVDGATAPILDERFTSYSNPCNQGSISWADRPNSPPNYCVVYADGSCDGGC